VFGNGLATRVIMRLGLLAAAAAVVAALRYHVVTGNGLASGAATIGVGLRAVVLVALVLAVIRVTWSVARFARSPRAARRNYPRMLAAAARWRWLTRNLGIAYPDPHAASGSRAPAGRTVQANRRARVQYPRARFRADEWGIVARVKTTPRAGRLEFERDAQHVADAWRCYRVQVTQPKPGRVIVRGICVDPLAAPIAMDAAPAGTYSRARYSPLAYLGRDEWGTERFANLYGVTGIAIGGLPDYGKTSLVRSLMCQDYGSPAVQHVVIDGKGGGDYLGQQERLWLPVVGNDLEKAAAVLARCEALMNRRLAAAGRVAGPVNRWEVGPTRDYPLIGITVDECHSFFDLEAVKGDKQAEACVRQCRSSTANMIRMGRSVLFAVKVITQKQTSDAIPTAIRDICQLSASFAAKTESGAEAVLGEQIRAYPSYSPVQLQAKPTYVGVCTVTLATGTDPFVRLRVPLVGERDATSAAIETAHHRRDPEALLDAFLDRGGYPYEVPALGADEVPASRGSAG